MELGYSPALDDALILAARAHRTQMRKGGDVPYVQHPVHVAIILLKHRFDEEVVIAGLLHDVVEDCGVDPAEIRARFGERVADLVASVTETKVDAAAGDSAPPRERPWRTRKEEALAHLANATPDSAALKAADALHNCQSTLRDLEAYGTAAWSRFNAPPPDQVWYYRAVAGGVRAKLGDHALWRELDAVVERIAAFA